MVKGGDRMETTNKEFVLLELFSGAGGFAKGLEDAGFKFRKHYFSEIDKHAIANYRYNFKNAEYVGPVQDVRGSGIERPDIITFGSPCQDFSLAGDRKGMGGERSVLILEAIRIIIETRPGVFIWENVKGAFTSNSGADFWAILAAFANIGGYRLEWQLLNTSWFLPQNRERIYLIGHLAGRSSGEVFPITEAIKRTTERVCKTEIVRTLTAGGNSGGLHSSMTLLKDVRPVLTPGRMEKRQNGRRFKENGEPSFTLNCQDVHGVMITTNTKKGFDVMTKDDSLVLQHPKSTTKRGRIGKGKAQTLDTGCNQGVLHKTSIRRLTEVECERLQGFPDDWTKYGVYDGEVKEISKTQRYKLCGNAVTTVVVKAIAEKLNLKS